MQPVINSGNVFALKVSYHIYDYCGLVPSALKCQFVLVQF